MVDEPRGPGIVGVLHVHSTFSDGELSLAALRRALLEQGVRFAALTDHAEAFDQRALDTYIEECRTLSDERFHFLPGLEFECDARMHILGYGCVTLPGSREPARVTAHITQAAGIPVLAHPLQEHIDALAVHNPGFRGVEAWNSKYDGRYAPRLAPFDLVRTLRARGDMVHAFFGLDLHWTTQFRGLQTVIQAPGLQTRDILAALAAGEFAGAAGHAVLASDGSLSPGLRHQFERAYRRGGVIRRALKRAKRLADRLGLRIPARLKNQFRRVM